MYRERASALVPGAIVWQLTGAAEHRVLPDGCTDFLWDGHRVRIAGPDTAAFVAPSGTATITGLRFAPGWGPSVFGVPADALRDQRVPLDAVWSPTEVAALTERLAASEHAGVELEALAAWRLRRGDVASLDVIDAIVPEVRAGRRVSTIAASIGFSERQLQRRSAIAFGYGPKMLARILRLGRALELARGGIDLADVAARSGYADQSHLANDSRALAGLSVGALLTT